MATSVVGSVTAELLLDTGKFTTSINQAKGLVEGLSGNFNSINAGNATKQITELEQKLSATNAVVKEQKNIISQLKSELESLSTEFTKNAESTTKNSESIKTVQTSLDSLKGSINSTVSETSKLNSELGITMNNLANAGNAFAMFEEKNAKSIANSKAQLATFKDEWLSFKVLYDGLLSTKPQNTWLGGIYEEVGRFGETLKQASAELYRFHEDFYKLSDLKVAGEWFEQIGMGATKSGEQIAILEKEIVSLESALRQLKSTPITPLNNIGNISIKNDSGAITRQKEALKQLEQAGLSANGSLVKFAEAQARLGNSLTTTNPKFAEQIGYLNRLKSSEDQASASATKLGNSTRQASSSMNTLTGATSKLQGALSSVKMMATALSSMFVWTFGMSLYEATKQTLQSKNEMESYLHQMGMGRGAINLFNQGLDETADRFKKLNKYMIGETIASIGMEFDLTANQMKKSMEVVAMVQNEYVRAGRKESEASLAVKDILQGEFLRLSRETGVGKQDLIDTGLWQGDLKDVEGLMDALKKVGEDRHWDLFASKCLSLNDVIQETKNRISEFGASIADQASPMIVNGFNIIVDIIDKVTETWNNFNPSEKLAVGIPSVLAFGTALMMVAGNLSLVDIAQMGYSRSLIATLLQLDVATVKEYGLATALSAKITGLEASTVAETGNLTAIMARLVGVDASIVKEYGFLSALVASTTAEEASSVATQLNTLAKEGNVIATSTGTMVTTEFTVVEELATMLKEENTVLTEANTIAKEMNNIANLGSFKSIVVLITGLKAEEVATMSTTEATWALITSLTFLEAITVVAVIAGIAVALGSLAMEAQRAKEAVDGFYDIVDNGDAYVEDANKNIESLTKQYDNLGNSIAEARAKGEDTWKLEQNQNAVKQDLEYAKANLADIQNVNESAKKSAEEFQNQITNANTDFERKNAEIFKKLGQGEEEARQSANQYTQKYLDGMDQMRTATSAYIQELDKGGKHIDTNVDALKEAGAETDTLVQYTKDYGEEVLKNAEYQKEWAEGDFWAIFKIALSDLKLAWIDFTYWIGEQQWYKDFCNALGEIQSAFGEVYTAIQPAIPYIEKFLGLLGSEIFRQFAGILYGAYEAGKLLYPILRFIAELHYRDFIGFVATLEELYTWVTTKGDEVKKWFDDFGNKTNEEKTWDIAKLLPGGIGGLVNGIDAIKQILDGIDFDFGKLLSDWFSEKSNGTTSGGTLKKIDLSWFWKGIFENISIDDIKQNIDEYIGKPFSDALNNFLSNPLGSLGISFDIGQFLSNLFGGVESAFEPVMSFINNNIITPFTDGLNQFISNPLMFMADLGMGLGIGGLLNGLFGGETGDASFSISTWVNDNIILPFTQSIQMGLLSIPIIGDIIAFLGLADSPEVQTTANEKGTNVGGSFGQAVENKIRSIPILGDILAWLGVIDGANPTANQKGHNVGQNIHDGVDNGKAGTADLVSNEMGEIINAIAGKVWEAYAQAQAIGSAILNGINSIIQHHSPGVPAQLIGAEMGEIVLAMDTAYDSVYESAQNIGYAITSGIQPNTDINFDAEAMAQYQADTMMAMGMADETVYTTESAFSDLDMSTAMTFSSIGTTIGTTMTNIANNTKLQYSNIALTTKTQLTNMQSQTTKNIGAIKQSWTGMQVALIASAEHIRSETGAKIHSLQNNMATFWRKVQNPALLLGAGSPSEDHGRRTRYSSHTSGVRKILSPSGFAGSPTISRSNSNPRGARTGTGISDKLPNRTVNGIKIYDILTEYLDCLKDGKPCYAGGWDFNWSDEIRQALLQWHTHFGDIYDPYLYVGKFENDNFPIRGIAPIALRYIEDAISRTSYSFYYNSRYGSPLEAWNAGSFNCYDGALVVMALASALGFPNSTMVHGSWNGIAHVWARIAGLGDIDATAIQGGYGLTAPSKYAGGDVVRPRFKHKGSSSDSNGGTGDIHINIDLSGATVSDDSIGERIGRRVRDEIIDLVSPNPSTGI